MLKNWTWVFVRGLSGIQGLLDKKVILAGVMIESGVNTGRLDMRKQRR